jgi:BarA-like signal transduction histidine kinase
MTIINQLETITPETAKEYLVLNINNRNLQKTTTELYARLMANGDWMINGDAVRFNVNGDMVDGQHRLAAVVQSGVPLTTFVIRGLPVEAQVTIDQQRKRTAGDMLHMRGLTNGNRLAAIVRMVNRWDDGERSMHGFSGGQVMLSAKEVISVIEADRDNYVTACRIASGIPLLTMASSRVTGTMWMLFQRADVALCEEFFDSLSSGTNLNEGDPVLTLRRYWINLIRNHRQSNTAVFLMAGVRSWNAYVEGRRLGGIAYKSSIIPEVSVPKPVVAEEPAVMVG